MSSDLYRGRVMEINLKEFTGRVKPFGGGDYIFFRFNRHRRVILDKNGMPAFGPQRTSRHTKLLSEGAEVIFQIGRDSYGRVRIHKLARAKEWDDVQIKNKAEGKK